LKPTVSASAATSSTTTERPGRLSSLLRIVRPGGAVTVTRDRRLVVELRAVNIGDTWWLHRGAGASRAGWTRVGVHLRDAGGPAARVVDFDWFRADFGGDVAPEDEVAGRLDLPPIGSSGAYDLEFDLVVEGMAWFAELGASRPPDPARERRIAAYTPSPRYTIGTASAETHP